MKKRRTLSQGMKPLKEQEENFILGKKATTAKTPSTTESSKKPKALPAQPENATPPMSPTPEISERPAASTPLETFAALATTRAPLTTRLRGDIAFALKQATLMRQLAGQEPNTVQEILDEVLEPWLKKHGHLPK